MEKFDKEANDSIKAARAIFEMSKLSVSQADGIVRKASGEIVGSQKWLVNADYSLDSKEGEDFIVNAVTQEDAEAKVHVLIEGIARRKGYVAGMVFINHTNTKESIDGK